MELTDERVAIEPPGPVAPEVADRIRSRIFRSLEKQGFQISADRLIPPDARDKGRLRELHRETVSHNRARSGAGLERLVVIDEAHRLAPRDLPNDYDDPRRVRSVLIDAARTTRKYGLGWMPFGVRTAWTVFPITRNGEDYNE